MGGRFICPEGGGPDLRRAARSDVRREAILSLAARSFLKRGYSGTTMSMIAAELGGSKGTLWRLFPSKDDLFVAVLRERMGAYDPGLEHILRDDVELRLGLQRFAFALIKWLTSRDLLAFHRLIVAEAGRLCDIAAQLCRQMLNRISDPLAAYLARQIDAGRLRAADPALAARAVCASCWGGSHMQVLWGGDVPSDAQIHAEVDQMIDLFLNGVLVAAHTGTRTKPIDGRGRQV